MGATHITAQDPRGNEKLGVNAAGPPRRGEDGVPARAAADTGTFTTIPGQRRRAPCHEPCACGRALADPAGPGGLSRARRARGVEGSVNTAERERGALTDLKETKENVTGQRDLCSLLVLEARLRAGPGGPSTARRLEKRSRNTC